MATDLRYMPTFRSRQQEDIVLRSFEFGDHMFPMIEIIKPYDRKRQEQKSFAEIYLDLINTIKAARVFVDLPLYIKQRGSLKTEVLAFSRGVINDRRRRTDHLLSFAPLSEKIIPVVSSFKQKTGEANTIELQANDLRGTFDSIAFRILVHNFDDDWIDVQRVALEEDFIILDLDTIAPYPSPTLKRSVINVWRRFNRCPQVLLRSAINTDVSNVKLDHGEPVLETDNGLLDMHKAGFYADAFGDYAGVKKDELTSGGTISPGFLFYDAINNEYIGYKGKLKSLDEFEKTIVPDVIGSAPAIAMGSDQRAFLSNDNVGWRILNRIRNGEESGKSQAKFKRIALEHYLHCIRQRVEAGEFD